MKALGLAAPDRGWFFSQKPLKPLCIILFLGYIHDCVELLGLAIPVFKRALPVLTGPIGSAAHVKWGTLKFNFHSKGLFRSQNLIKVYIGESK